MKKVVIVGFGGMGSKYADMIYKGQIEGLQLYGILCRNIPGQEKIRETMPEVVIYENEDMMFEHTEDYDAIIITTPHKEHVRVVKKAQDAGLHVLCEKPLGVLGAECEAVCKNIGNVENRCDKSGEKPVNAMIFNWRARDVYREVKALLEQQEIGKLHHVLWIANFWYRPECYHNMAAWRSSWKGEGGGLLINQSQHLMDMWNWLFGQPDRVFSRMRYGQYSGIEVEDEVTLLFSYDTGVEGTFFSSTGDSPGTNRLEIHGDKGKLVVEDDRRITIYRNEQSIADMSKNATDPYCKIPCTKENRDVEQKCNEYITILQNFSDAMHGKAKPLADLTDGLKAIQNTNTAYLADWEKQWMAIPCDSQEYAQELDKRMETEKKGKR